MLTTKKTTDIHTLNSKGFATIESIAMMMILVTLMSYVLGTFGTIHTGILHSISARAYLFEVMDHRADINYFRSHPQADLGAGPHRPIGFRYSGIMSAVASAANNGDPKFRASARNVAFTAGDAIITDDSETTEHARVSELNLNERATRGVDNVWIKVAYGICLTASCGGVQ